MPPSLVCKRFKTPVLRYGKRGKWKAEKKRGGLAVIRLFPRWNSSSGRCWLWTAGNQRYTCGALIRQPGGGCLCLCKLLVCVCVCVCVFLYVWEMTERWLFKSHTHMMNIHTHTPTVSISIWLATRWESIYRDNIRSNRCLCVSCNIEFTC